MLMTDAGTGVPVPLCPYRSLKI